jgi:hypothetical protein
MNSVESSPTNPNLTAGASIQQATAVRNMKLILLSWYFIFSFAAVFEIVLSPTSDNIACVLLAWASCLLTGAVMIRGRVTFLFPWSSLMVLVFCLSTCGLPLLLLPLQDAPLTFHLEVPVATFSHLFICQMLLLLIHGGYRNAKILRRWENGFRLKVLRPLGLLKSPSWIEALAMGGVGLAASAYVYIILRDRNAGTLDITGSVTDKFVQGLYPLTFVPFVVLVYQSAGTASKGLSFRLGFTLLYALPVFVLAMAYNTRVIAFYGFANIAVYLALLVISGKMHLHLFKFLIIGGVALVLLLTVGSDVSVAMRMARADRDNVAALDLVRETWQLLTTKRDELAKERALFQGGGEIMEAWYVSSPVFSRFICTHFQDRVLAIALSLSEGDKEKVRRAEIDHLLASLPNPILKILASPQINLLDATFDKNQVEVGGSTIGGYMVYLGGNPKDDGVRDVLLDENGKMIGDVYSYGGFIGDGFAAYGWGYLLLFGLAAFMLFLYSDSLYGFMLDRSNAKPVWVSSFAIVGLVNAFVLAYSLTGQSLEGFYTFLFREQLQLLLTYTLVFWAVRILGRAFLGGGSKPVRAQGLVVEHVE